MGRIRVLSDQVANKIAAGEVVERPASVIKELLENSIDAGGTDIRIEVEAGGRRLLRIADNGCGMMRDDALLAFERHATSKLSSVDDLNAIATLGFRGEALPSIASVSRLVLETRAENESVGTRVEIAGGKLLDCAELAFPGGTTITVRDLFFNVPARKKFLRSEQTELSHIASLVTHYSLAHCEKSFTLTHGGKELLGVTPVTNLRDRVFQIFGGDTLEDLIDLGSRETMLTAEPEPTPFRISGYVSRPQVQKNNRNSIFLFVNGRLIRDRMLIHAISAAYHNLIPPACYPFALLFVDCDPGQVDVNVHPSKTEVRFRHGTFVHDLVRDSLRETLIAARPAPSAPLPVSPVGVPYGLHAQPVAALPYSEFTQALEDMRFDEARNVLPGAPSVRVEEFGRQTFPDAREPGGAGLEVSRAQDFFLRPPQGPETRFDFQGAPLTFDGAPGRPALPTPGLSPALSPEGADPLRMKVPDTHSGFPPGLNLEASQSMANIAELRVLGQIYDSFILAAGTDGLWIFDQHVVHERILFERNLARQAAGRVEQQRLLMPIVLSLTPAQQVEYDRLAADLATAGFETEPFGNRTIAVKAVPADIEQSAVEGVIYEILEIAESEMRRVSVEDIRRGIAASLACRAAIKINMRLDESKMEYLLRELSRTACPMSCPHGRPVALRYSTRDILRSFHRI
jgi:DNA mismatch repair protein MutL